MSRKLTPKQKMFVAEYLCDLNATQAAIRAGYSEHTANEQGSRLLANVSVSEAVQEAMDKRAESVKLDADGVLDIITDTLSALRGETDEKKEKNAQAIFKGVELYGKHLKMFTEKVEHSGVDGKPIEFSNTERAARLAAILERGREERDRQSDK